MWQLPTSPANESARLRILEACGIMDAAPDERFDRITRLASRIYDADVSFIGLIDDKFQSLISVSSNALGRNVPRRDSVCNMLVASGQPMVVGDLHTDPRLRGHPLVPQIPLGFYAGVPILGEPGAVLGTLCVMKREPEDAAAFDLGPLLDLSAIASSEIGQWRANLELRRQSETDSLTNLPNRRRFDEDLATAVRRTHRTGLPVSLLIADLDHFKQLNDFLGHDAGDRALQQMAELLAVRRARPLDSVARIGGEEFALLLPDTDEAEARVVAQDLLNALRQTRIGHPTRGAVSASIGGATMSGATVTTATLFRSADAALYAAKNAGRDTFRAHALNAVCA